MLRRFPIESKGRRKKLNEVIIEVNNINLVLFILLYAPFEEIGKLFLTSILTPFLLDPSSNFHLV